MKRDDPCCEGCGAFALFVVLSVVLMAAATMLQSMR